MISSNDYYQYIYSIGCKNYILIMLIKTIDPCACQFRYIICKVDIFLLKVTTFCRNSNIEEFPSKVCSTVSVVCSLTSYITFYVYNICISNFQGSGNILLWYVECRYKVQVVQVNLCQKLLFLHQLTHNMKTDCSLNYKFNT